MTAASASGRATGMALVGSAALVLLLFGLRSTGEEQSTTSPEAVNTVEVPAGGVVGLAVEPQPAPASPAVAPLREDLIGLDGNPIDVTGYSAEEIRALENELYPPDNPEVRSESARRYIEYLFRKGRVSQNSYDQIFTGKTCMYGPANAPAGMTHARIDEIMKENSHRPPREQWERIMSEPARADGSDEKPIVVSISAPDGPNCIVSPEP